MRYRLTPMHSRPSLLNGLSTKLIESHYENNYGGALRRLNAITAQLEALDFSTAPGYVVAGLKREELVALNSTLLHELYFASFVGDGKPVGALAEALARDFGSVDRWRAEFTAMARALGGGSGWVLLVYVPRDGRLVNQYAAEHSQGIAGGVPVLALDMYEHAYHIDFGANAGAYIDAYMRNLNFEAANKRYEDARNVAPFLAPLVQPEFADLPSLGVEEVKALLDAGQPVQVIDARPRHFYSRSPEVMQGATWRDPERVQDWIGELSRDKPVVTFCAWGFHVGCQTAAALRDAGYDVKWMTGGHSAWKAIGGATTQAAP